MSNSPLVSYIKISPNKTVPRNHTIDTITIHCVVGQLSVEQIGNVFAPSSVKASSNYGIGFNGRIGMYVEEKDRSWCSSNRDNDHRAITIECACDLKHPYVINDAVYNSLINLCVDICKRNGIKELKWKADKSLIGKVEEQNMTVHRWFANKACPGDYIYNRLGEIAFKVNQKLAESGINQNGSTTTLYCVQVGAFSNRTNAENMVIKLKKAGFDGFITMKINRGGWMISVTHKGSFKNIESFFKRAPKVDIRSILEKYAKRGVDALSANTPQDTGLTANSWGYDIHQSNGNYTITWTNTNVVSGIPVAILLQYGHATKNGGFVQGVDFINPALKPLFDNLAKDLWEEVKSL